MEARLKPLLVITAVFLNLSVSAGCSREEAPPPEVIRAIKTITVTERATAQTRKFSGVIEPVDKSSLSFEVAGNVKEVNFDVGQEFKAGQVLATLDKLTFQLDLDAARAKLARAHAELAEKEAEYNRYQKVNEESPGAVSQSSVDQTKAAFMSARENVRVASSELNLAQRDMQKTALAAPFDGVIAKRYVEPFFEVKRGDPVFDVFVEGAMEVATSIPETDIEGIFRGQACDIVFPTAPGSVYRGLVSDIGRLAEAANAFPVKVKILTIDPKLRPGMTAELTFRISEAAQQRAFLVPVTALAAGAEPRKGYVFVFDPATSTVRRVPVKVIPGAEDDRLMVSEGLAGGEIIAVAGVSFLEDGQKVKLMASVANASESKN
jgi:multidrug efflux system membrane fusion protein